MPHERPRHLLSLLRKRMRLWPVIGILGPRQSGKSTLLRNQLKPSTYISLDSPSVRKQAARAPELFVREELLHKTPVTLDEIQKVPELFDVVKLTVDENRRPGMFVISGSTQFSERTGIRESLTGRIGLQRLYPFTAAEANSHAFERPIVDLFLGKTGRGSNLSLVDVARAQKAGGMPGLCFLRNEAERAAYVRGWLETTCFRDALQIRGIRLDPTLLMNLVEALCRTGLASATDLKDALRVDLRRIKSHLDVLTTLFVVSKIDRSPLGIGQAKYILFDSGFAAAMGGDRDAILSVWFFNEMLAQSEYSGEGSLQVQRYQTKSGAAIDFLLPKYKLGFTLSTAESPSEYSLRAARAFLRKHSDWRVVIAAPATRRQPIDSNLVVIPWNFLC